MTTKEIILLVILLVTLVVLVSVFLIIRHIEKYRNDMMDILVPKNEDYYRSLNVVDKCYVEYHEENASFVDFSFKSKGDFDEVSALELKKHYKFFRNKIFYLINGVLSGKLDIKEIENKKYIKLNDTIKSLHILVSYGNKTNLLIKYDVIKKEDGYILEINNEEVDFNEK